MMHVVRSFSFAMHGLVHAFRHERNLQRFLAFNIVLAIVGIVLEFSVTIWLVLALVSLLFIVVELFNTALERLADTIDDCEKRYHGGHYHPGIKMAKDTAAAASLIALLIFCLVVAWIITSYVRGSL